MRHKIKSSDRHINTIMNGTCKQNKYDCHREGRVRVIRQLHSSFHMFKDQYDCHREVRVGGHSTSVIKFYMLKAQMTVTGK